MSDASKLGWIGLVCLVALSGHAHGGSIKYGATALPYSYPFYQASDDSPATPIRWRSYAVNGLSGNRLGAPASAPAPTLAPAPVTTTNVGLFASLANNPVPPTPSSSAVSTVSAPSVQMAARLAPAPAAVSTPAPVVSTPPPSNTADAFLNFGSGPYPSASALGADSASAWYNSPVVTKVFGGTPSASQQLSFEAEVRDVVQKIYNNSGLPIDVTIDPSRASNHTMSLVSNASASSTINAIGLTEVGRSGMTFVDKFGQAANVDQLAEAVGHNMAHELMHAFGIAEHPDTTGSYIDAGQTSWSLLTDPNTTFSPDAKALLLSLRDNANTTSPNALGAQMLASGSTPTTCNCPACQALRCGSGINPAPVPEPATVALWTIGGLGLVWHARRKKVMAA